MKELKLYLLNVASIRGNESVCPYERAAKGSMIVGGAPIAQHIRFT